jgi:hypothetical protein
MKKMLAVIPALFLAFTLMAQPPEGNAEKGTVYGDKTSETGSIQATELKAFLSGKEKADIKVQGVVTEVCKAEGCWLRMETGTGSMLIKMKDHKFLVPLALSGKNIVAEGTATMKETSVEMLRHYAEDAGKSAEEIAAITEPKKEIVLQAKGILVL